MYFLYKCRVCGQTFTSQDFPHLDQTQAAEEIRRLFNNHSRTRSNTFRVEDDAEERWLFRELICEHPDGCGIADLLGTSRDPIAPPIENLAPEGSTHNLYHWGTEPCPDCAAENGEHHLDECPRRPAHTKMDL